MEQDKNLLRKLIYTKAAYIESGINSKLLDIDNDCKYESLTDGLVITTIPLTNAAVASVATRSNRSTCWALF
jgi:hypothetical protein